MSYVPPENLFEVYAESAAQALKENRQDSCPDSTELIRGLENLDMQGLGGDFVAQRVLTEAGLVCDALRAHKTSHEVNLWMPMEVGRHRGVIPAWNVMPLESAPTIEEKGSDRGKDVPWVALSTEGQLYVYSLSSQRGVLEPRAILRRYAPVCRTRINDRSILYGLAVISELYNLDIQPPAINATVEPAASS
jgi:hypothetical protein